VHTGEDDDAWEALAAEFNELYPNITIQFQDVPFEEMHDKLLTQVAANNPPDAAYIDAGTVGEFALRGALVNLDDYISKSNVINLDDYVDAFLSAASAEGSYYGLPIDGETTGLFYRTDRFEEAGLDPNSPPKTWEEFQEYAEKLTDPDNNHYGYMVFATDYESSYYFLPWLWQAGGMVLNPDDPNDVIVDNEAGQKAANFYVNLKNYSSPDFLNSNSYDGRVAFANGDVAMYMAGSWFAGTLLDEFPEATGLWATAPLPQDEQCATTVASDHLVVFSGGKNQEAAYKWIEFVSAPQNMLELNLGTPEAPSTLLPPRISLLEDPATYENREVLRGFADAMQCAFFETAAQPEYYKVDEALFGHLNRAFYDEYPDGATAVIEAAKEAEARLLEE
jgi:multiple sugar transport system substrate-binding protein